jgi:hypothetical protein
MKRQSTTRKTRQRAVRRDSSIRWGLSLVPCLCRRRRNRHAAYREGVCMLIPRSRKKHGTAGMLDGRGRPATRSIGHPA